MMPRTCYARFPRFPDKRNLPSTIVAARVIMIPKCANLPSASVELPGCSVGRCWEANILVGCRRQASPSVRYYTINTGPARAPVPNRAVCGVEWPIISLFGLRIYASGMTGKAKFNPRMPSTVDVGQEAQCWNASGRAVLSAAIYLVDCFPTV